MPDARTPGSNDGRAPEPARSDSDEELAPLIDEWRGAWRELRPPACPVAPVEGDGGPAMDAPTRAAVEWLAAAWGASGPARSDLPWRWRRREQRDLLVRAAAAAALLVALPLLAGRGVGPAAPGAAAPSTASTALTAAGGPLVAAIERDRTEIRSGPVRLILFTGPSDADGTPSPAPGPRSGRRNGPPKETR